MVLGVSSVDFAVQRSVQNAFERLANVSLKLATLQRIQRAGEDPAGLIAAEELTGELAAIEAAARSADRARAFTQLADSALANAGGLLTEIQANLVAAANDTISAEERAALQQEIDASLDALNRLGNTTYGGRRIFGETTQFLAGHDPIQVATLELPAIDDSLGSSSGVLADLRSGGPSSLVAGGDLETATNIVDQARSQIVTSRAKIGTFERGVFDSLQRVLDGMHSNLATARSAIRDADVAAEASNLVREMVLAQSSMQTARLLTHSRKLTRDLVSGLFDASR
jgi:flagellin